MRRVECRILVAAAFTLLVASPSSACTVSAIAVSFGVYGQLAAPTDGVGSIQTVCHPSDQAQTVSLSTGSSGNFITRRMTSGPAHLNYNLYTGPDHSVIWGNGGGGSVTMEMPKGTVNAGKRTSSRTIYGRIPAGQKPAAGSYSDTLMMTVTF